MVLEQPNAPQQLTWPVLRTAQVDVCPASMATASERVGTMSELPVGDCSPPPSWRNSFWPQQYTCRLGSNAQACRPPSASMVAPLTPLTERGVNDGSRLELTWKIAAGRLPQTNAAPDVLSAMVPSLPARASLAAERPETATGADAGADTVSLVPSCPASLLPQQRSSSFCRTAHACRDPTLTERAGLGSATASGGPSSAAASEPQQYTLPPERTAQSPPFPVA